MRLEKLIKSKGFISSPFNTNNSWGFGGGVGISYVKDSVEIRIGKAYYRHLPSHKFITLSLDGKTRVDISEKQLITYLENILYAKDNL